MQHWQAVVPKAGFKIVGHTRRAQVATMMLTENERIGSATTIHPMAEQWLYVLSGRGSAVVAAHTVTLAPGSLLLIEAGEPHELSSHGDEPLQLLSFNNPPIYKSGQN